MKASIARSSAVNGRLASAVKTSLVFVSRSERDHAFDTPTHRELCACAHHKAHTPAARVKMAGAGGRSFGADFPQQPPRAPDGRFPRTPALGGEILHSLPDVELKNIIDKLANFVARNGPEFEQMTMNKQRDNPKFQFLFGGEWHAYYKWRVVTEQQGVRVCLCVLWMWWSVFVDVQLASSLLQPLGEEELKSRLSSVRSCLSEVTPSFLPTLLLHSLPLPSSEEVPLPLGSPLGSLLPTCPLPLSSLPPATPPLPLSSSRNLSFQTQLRGNSSISKLRPLIPRLHPLAPPTSCSWFARSCRRR